MKTKKGMKKIAREFNNRDLAKLLNQMVEKMGEKRSPENSYKTNEYHFILEGMPRYFENEGHNVKKLRELKKVEGGIFYNKVLEGIQYIRRDLGAKF